MGNYGLKITKEGKDITSTDPDDYIFNSKWGSVKVYSEPPNKSYQTIIVPANSNATVSIAHGLPFVPLVMFFTELKPGSGHFYTGSQCKADPTDTSGGVTIEPFNSYIDTTYIKMKYVNPTGGDLTVKYYYFIFADNG